MIRATSRHRESQVKNGAGFTLLEVSVSGVLLVVVMVVAVQMLGWVAAERRAADRRLCATQEAANVMERLTVLPWDDLTEERVAKIELSAQAHDVLPEGELNVQLIAEPDRPNAKRLTVQVRWRPRPGQRVAPVRLTAWVYRRGGQGP